jgi:hypothetical protein
VTSCGSGAGNEESQESQRRSLQERIERAREHIDGFESERETAQALPRRERHEELARIDSWEARSRRETARLEAELADRPVVGHAARRELAVADQVLAQRRELAIAARISPLAHVKAELGRGRAIRLNERHGIAASRRSSATARSTASPTQTSPWARARQLGKGLSIGR